MKILTYVCNLNIGGVQRVAQNFILSYKSLGHDSRVLVNDYGFRLEELKKNKIIVYNKNNFSEIESWVPDLIHLHAHQLNDIEVRKLYYTIKKINPKLKIVETNVFSTISPWDDILDYSFHMTAWCEWIYKNKNGSARTAIIPNPQNTKSFVKSSKFEIDEFKSKIGININDRIICRIGQKSEVQWSTSIIEVFEKLSVQISNLKLLLVNPPINIINKISDLTQKLKDNIIVLDEIKGDKNLSICYSSANVFYHHSSIGESFGNVLAESLLCEVPCVTVSTPWSHNSQSIVVPNGIGGYVVKDSKIAEKAIKKILQNEKLGSKMGRNGRKYIVENFDTEIVASNVINLVAKKNINMPLKEKIYKIYINSFSGFDWRVYLLLRFNIFEFDKRLRFIEGFSKDKIFIRTILFEKTKNLLLKVLKKT
jgi:glycosyltransferase involved in cell wall biosynthesis